MSATLLDLVGFIDSTDTFWRVGSVAEANPLLSQHHYLGPIKSGGAAMVLLGGPCGGSIAAVQVWRLPTARNLPADGSWLELSRWCLTPAAGRHAGSRQHRYAVRVIKAQMPQVTTLVSYSDPSHGHGGSLYRACNWIWAPTWHRLRTPPSGNGSWQDGVTQSVKDRWIFPVRSDTRRADAVKIYDAAAIRSWLTTSTAQERRWAGRNPQLRQAMGETS